MSAGGAVTEEMKHALRIFRALVVCHFIFTFAYWLLPYFALPLSDVAISILAYDGADASVVVSPTVYWVMLFVWGFLCVALLSGYRFAREVFLAYSIFSLGLGLLFGTRVLPALDGLVGGVMVLLQGAILGLAFWGKVSVLYGPKREAHRESV